MLSRIFTAVVALALATSAIADNQCGGATERYCCQVLGYEPGADRQIGYVCDVPGAGVPCSAYNPKDVCCRARLPYPGGNVYDCSNDNNPGRDTRCDAAGRDYTYYCCGDLVTLRGDSTPIGTGCVAPGVNQTCYGGKKDVCCKGGNRGGLVPTCFPVKK